MVLGLAPAAHGGNRTGRIFTGDRSGDWLFASLYRVGMANQPTSRSRDDGLALTDCWVCAAVRCAPPANKPTPAERDTCLPYAARELELLKYLAEGYTNKEIARAMVLAEDTVKKAVQTLIAKLGATDRTHAVVIALRSDLIQ
jgi:DNA-binding CsgD family transcriptional regulator